MAAKNTGKRKPPGQRQNINQEKQWAGTLQKRILFRPERAPYIKNQSKKSGCVFCEALKQGVKFKSLVLAETKFSFVVLNKYPYNTGHLLVLPKSHSKDPSELSRQAYADLTELLRLSLQVLEVEYKPQGINVGLNLGKAAGAGIPDHLHFHIVPRWKGDLNFFPLIAQTKTLIETLEQTYERLKLPFKKAIS